MSNIGHSKFTSLGTPWEVVYQEFYDSLPAAKKREVNIKRMKSRKYIEELIAKAEHPDLNREGPGFESQPVHE